jgi:hypothetical protein
MESDSRLQLKKLTSMPLFGQLEEQASFDLSGMHTPKISIDTRVFGPSRAAQNIVCARSDCGANERGFAPRHAVGGAVVPNLHRLQWKQ